MLEKGRLPLPEGRTGFALALRTSTLSVSLPACMTSFYDYDYEVWGSFHTSESLLICLDGLVCGL